MIGPIITGGLRALGLYALGQGVSTAVQSAPALITLGTAPKLTKEQEEEYKRKEAEANKEIFKNGL